MILGVPSLTYVLYRDNLLDRSATTDVGRNELLGLLAWVLVEGIFCVTEGI
jgi:hypothetical protein